MTGTIVEFILLLVAHAAAGIYSSALKYSRKVTYLIWGIWITVQSGLLFYTEFVATSKALQFFVGFVLSLLGQYVIYFATTKGKVGQRIFTMMTYSIFFCIAMSLNTIVHGTFTGLHWTLAALIQAAMLLAVVTCFLRFVCARCRTAARNITTGWTRLIIVNLVFMVALVLSTIFPTRLTTFRDPAFVTFSFLSIFIMAVYPVVFSSINSMSEAAEKREVETQNKLLVAQIDAETQQMEADRQARHDRRHHNLIMLEFAKNNDIENVREYLKTLVETDTAGRSELSYCDNTTVNAILSVYARRARESGITVNIKASVSRHLTIAPKDLVIVIANIFENAIHAAERQKNKEPYVDISIKEDPKRLIVIAKNPCRERMVFDEDCYGVGIRSIISTVNGYEGMYDFTAEGGIFSAKVSMNLE